VQSRRVSGYTAWQRAFHEAGLQVAAWRIHRSIGINGSTLVDQLSNGADDAVFVGDTVWDVEAGARAGVPCIGVLSGGVSRRELEDAGAAAVFDDAYELCEHFDDSPIAALI
jgi:hypothetical protein